MILLNKRIDILPQGAVNIGRPSKYGNPFKVKTHTIKDHQIAVDMYRIWLTDMLREYPNFLNTLLDVEYIWCWCKPLPCHGDVILEFVERIKQS